MKIRITEVRELLKYDEMELDKLGDKDSKMVIFAVLSDTDHTFSFLHAIMMWQAIDILCRRANIKYHGKLPRMVNFIFDEFANIGKLPDIEHTISVVRSRNIAISIILQSMAQLDTTSYMFNGCSSITTLGDLSGWDVSKVTDASYMFDFCSSITTLGDLSGWDVSSLKYAHYMFTSCSNLILDCSKWDVYKVRGHNGFNTNAPGVILPLAWQASSDEDGEDSAIAPLCEEQGNRDALRVSDENGNDKAVSKTDGETSADSETEGSNTASATDEAGAKEETSDDIVQEEPAAA